MSAPLESGPREAERSCGDCRCACGRLLARLTPAGVELKCRGCKRTVVVPLAEPAGRAPRRAGPRVSLGASG